ncbi:hypothetical protein K505DRAFT_379435 [Melanomma pulvis-pyrius CBS 109.77]|uniref:EKC/KEOPS complex subunit BUD32 n=1 Tax=Melanomma pulvis-pyrius CBS 109.77 TaxID=1314802 RepID=A0A6A6WV92_9PLEO|nr:hypothetical protein K505DRAFT_379435 [Melanomma pulvis-pyrius CBS 109.77]
MSEADVVHGHPIGEGLDEFRHALKSTFERIGIHASPSSQGSIALFEASSDVRNLWIRLFFILQALPAAEHLRSKTGRESLRSDLLGFASTVLSSDFDLKSVLPLAQHILDQAPDQNIWDAVIALVTLKTTPPSLPSALSLDTPLKSTSSSQRANEQTHDDMDERILQEINGCVYKDTGGFYEKYFEGKEWSTEAERITERVDPQVRNGRWTEYPALPSQTAFLNWLQGFQADFLGGGHGMFCDSPNLPLAGSGCKRKPDLFLAPSSASKHTDKYDWADIRVIGELKQSEVRGKYTEELLNFSGHAREVFAAQPTRRFLHGFIIRGSSMELWVFDRSGPYGSEKFDIHEDPRRFIKIMFGYTRMGDGELGVNTYIKEDEDGNYIVLEEEGKEKERLYLEDKPIAFQRAIVCRGTACYRAKKRESERWEYVVKFAWRSDKRRAEGELLKLAKERNVWGVAKLISHQDLETIADMRRGLDFRKPQRFRSAGRDSINQSRSRQSSMLAAGPGISLTPLSTSSSGQKRKRAEDRVMAPPPKRSKSGSRRRSSAAGLATAQLDGAGLSTGANENPNANSITALEGRDNGSFENRIFSCLVISPPGRLLREFTSVQELLEACRDFVRAHRSLYEDGKILHRDISENNIIITDAQQEGDPKGMLIDLDLGKELDGGPTGARHRTGTMEFMAIEVLEGKPHTYRHDLESFFYVFLWVIVQGRDRTLLKTSQLRDWYRGGYTQIANMKRGHMDKKAFRGILMEFSLEFISLKGLAEELRDVLFPYREGLFTGTYSDADRLYQPMIEAFERAITRH